MPVDGLTTYGRQRGGVNDGKYVPFRATRENDQTVAQALPPYYELVRQGRVYHGNVAAAGVVIPIYTNTTQQIGLWNPAGSAVDVVLLDISLTYVGTTGAAGGYVIAQLANAPAAIGTGLAITAFTETAAVPAYNGAGQSAIAKFGQGATLTVTTPTVYRHLGLNQNAFTAAGTGQMAFENRISLEGLAVAAPGTAFFIAGNIATLATWSGTLTWAEIPRLV